MTHAGTIAELTAIVSRAAAVILALDPTKVGRRAKPDGSPVSAADEAAEAVIIEGLSRVLPGLPVVSEEAVAREQPSELGRSFALVDPLDGTREFLAGSDEFTVNVAIVVDARPRLGIIAAPALGLIWRGVVSAGAERLRLSPGSRLDEVGEIASIRTRRRPADGLAAMISRSHFDAGTAAFLDGLPITSRVACGSSLKFCRIAEGAQTSMCGWGRLRNGMWLRGTQLSSQPAVWCWGRTALHCPTVA